MMLKGIKKHENKEHGKTLKHGAACSINHKVTQNKNNTRTTTLERSVAKTTGCFKNIFNCRQTSPWVSIYFLIQKYIRSSVYEEAVIKSETRTTAVQLKSKA